MAGRDRVVLLVLMVGGAVALLAWRGIGPWPASVVAVLAVLVASVVYRIEPPRIDLGRPLPPLIDSADTDTDRHEDTDTAVLDQAATDQ